MPVYEIGSTARPFWAKNHEKFVLQARTGKGAAVLSTRTPGPDRSGGFVLWGGEDISPSMYKQRPNSFTGAGNSRSSRDVFEEKMVQRAVAEKRPIVGVCRGAQLLCAIAGGSLVQHVNRHGGQNHVLRTYDEQRMFASSLHHQMMNPEGSIYEMLAVTESPLASIRLGEDDADLEMDHDPEVVFFPELNALAIQPHPEMMSWESDFCKWVRKEIDTRFGDAFYGEAK